IDASVVDNKLKLSPDATHSFAFANDNSNFLQVAGLNTFFSGYSAGTIEVNEAVADNLNFLAAATVTSKGELFEGDNSNAVAMAKLSESKVMNGGKSTLADVFENTKIDIGSKTKAAEVRVGSAEAIYQQAYARVESESGVNLDEEAANLMRFQQAYQASARIMTTAQQIFDTLLTSVR
ncbi:flagellar basal body rod C-terminal domain-containing protein, partial [Shewanella putrefaciens]|uniref:flagellar basal body rod C-terminal domain-containing protein n=1 Tax=Shewanella putrefaciens TaxID=24 RepID=UPI0035659696